MKRYDINYITKGGTHRNGIINYVSKEGNIIYSFVLFYKTMRVSIWRVHMFVTKRIFNCYMQNKFCLNSFQYNKHINIHTLDKYTMNID